MLAALRRISAWCLIFLPVVLPVSAGAADSKVDVAARLMQTAPYKVEIATSDGAKVMITNAYTLERRRLWEKPGLATLAFSPDGEWLYAIVQTGEVVAIDPDAGKVVPLGKVPVQAGERVVEAVGLGPADQYAVAVVMARPQGAISARGCGSWTAPRRVTLRRPMAGGATTLEAREGWPEDGRTPRLTAISPNTRVKASIVGPTLQGEGRFGAPSSQLSRTPLPASSFAIDWMRDSGGAAVLYAKKPEGACKARVGARFFRQDGAGWAEWSAPDQVELARPDLPWMTAAAAPDGMRWLGVEARGVVLVEPTPRFRGKIALVAPPSAVWPKLRPGVRALPSLVGGGLRLTELLTETGDLDAAEEELQRQLGKAGPADVVKLRTRLQKLAEVRVRRAQELGLQPADVRSRPDAAVPANLPVTVVPAQPATDDDAVEPAAAGTPTGR